MLHKYNSCYILYITNRKSIKLIYNKNHKSYKAKHKTYNKKL